MNYKKLLNDQLDRHTDNTPAVVALLAGLAIGAALGVLFAPTSGTETRDLISDKTKDLAESAKDKLMTCKEKIKSGTDDLTEIAKKKYQAYSGKSPDNLSEDLDTGVKDA